jgi:putative transposase
MARGAATADGPKTLDTINKTPSNPATDTATSGADLHRKRGRHERETRFSWAVDARWEVAMHRTYKFRLYPNRNQERELDAMLETHRRLYNAALDARKTAYEQEKKSIGYVGQCRWFTEEKKTNTYYQKLNRCSAEVTLRHLDLAFQAFFRRAKAGEKSGYPRFRSRDRFSRIPFRPLKGGGFALIDGRLKVQFVGSIRIKIHREITAGPIKTASLKKEAGHWYVTVTKEVAAPEVFKSTNPPIGIDVGIESFLTTSDGEHVANTRQLKKSLPELRRQSRSLARKKRGSASRKKQKIRVAKVHAKVRNQRRHFHHLTANDLVRRFGVIAVESLNVHGMLRNHRLARAISDAGWHSFITLLTYKAISAGGQVVAVDCRGTSQECSGCGEVVKKPLSQRWHECGCGTSLHRDHNAARNILARCQARTEPVVANVGNG